MHFVAGEGADLVCDQLQGNHLNQRPAGLSESSRLEPMENPNRLNADLRNCQKRVVLRFTHLERLCKLGDPRTRSRSRKMAMILVVCHEKPMCIVTPARIAGVQDTGT